MSKLWNSVCSKTSSCREKNKLPVPDYTKEKLSCWTYADMKREFTRSMEFFAENGFSEERVFSAYRCVRLFLYFIDKEKPDISSITENVMASTICIIEAFKTNSDLKKVPTKRKYERQISEYRTAETHGLVLSEEESAELSEDIKTALELLQNSGHIDRKKEDDGDRDNYEGFPLKECRKFTMQFKHVLRSPPPADSDERLRARLSERAYKMLTEYERESEITDLDFLENEYLKPNGLEFTNELREFVELYGGREYAWQVPMFVIDYPYSLNSYKGYSIGLELTWTGTIEGDNYYIPAMSQFTGPYTGPAVGRDGKIYILNTYDYYGDLLLDKPFSPEEFFESEARERYKDELLLKRRRELENKYLIPEIRTASM